MELPSSSSSSSSSSTSSSFITGSRALDRHNPIITDEKRSGFSSNSCTNTPIRTPCRNNVYLQQKPTTPVFSPKPHQSTPKKKGNKIPTLTQKTSKKKNNNNVIAAAEKPPILRSVITENADDQSNVSCGRRSFSEPSDLIMKAAACSISRPGLDYISPPESSRYLLDDTSFLQVFSDFDPVLKSQLPPAAAAAAADSLNIDKDNNNNVEVLKSSQSSRPPKPSSSSDQVVVLRVSLHCRGCERKMKKHLSRMAGVTSFNIDFAAKKVTVVGDVTPLGVLASISKVKTAQLWTPAISSSSHFNSSKNMQLKKQSNQI